MGKAAGGDQPAQRLFQAILRRGHSGVDLREARQAHLVRHEEGPNSYRVALADIVANDDLSLAAGQYRAAKIDRVEHDDPREILHEVVEIEADIARRAEALVEALKG